jgi:hypothetical protein
MTVGVASGVEHLQSAVDRRAGFADHDRRAETELSRYG